MGKGKRREYTGLSERNMVEGGSGAGMSTIKVVQGMQIHYIAMLCMHIDYVGRKALE